MASKADVGIIWHGFGHHDDSLWQPKLYKDDRESDVPWHIEAYRNLIFLCKGYGIKRSYQAPICGYQWASCWYTGQSFISNEAWVFIRKYWCSLEGIFSQGGKVMELQMMDHIQKKKFMSEKWTLLGQRGSSLMIWKLPRKGGVMMRLTSMMDDNDDGLTFISGR